MVKWEQKQIGEANENLPIAEWIAGTLRDADPKAGKFLAWEGIPPLHTKSRVVSPIRSSNHLSVHTDFKITELAANRFWHLLTTTSYQTRADRQVLSLEFL